METTDLSFLQSVLSEAPQKLADTYCLGLLQPLMTGYPFVPVTTGSLRPLALVEILNEVIVNGRKNIIEFGTGLSTLLIGRLIKKNALDIRLLSVEQDEGWVNVMTGLLRNEGINEAADILYAPLAETALARDGNLWYDVNILDDRTDGSQFDLVIVDGPTAWQTGRELARYPALPYIFGKLSRSFCVYLDDINRPGESSIIQLWQNECKIQFSTMGDSLAYFKTPGSFHSAPI